MRPQGGQRRPTRRLLVILGVLLVALPGTPAIQAFHEHSPLVLELQGDSGDAWAVAVRSDDNATSFRGNELVVGVWTHPPFQASLSSAGVLELKRGGDGNLYLAKGGVGATIEGEDRLLLETIGIDTDPSAPVKDQLRATGPTETGTIGLVAERRFMEPGEWRYFVAWAAGADSSTFRLQGEGYEIRELVTGEAHALGTHELVDDGGTRVRQGLSLPPGTSQGTGYVGAGATSVSDTGTALTFENAPIGVFAEFHTKDACVRGGCVRAGNALDDGLSNVQDGGFANISITDPDGSVIWNQANHYWLELNSGSERRIDSSPGRYSFNVEQLTDATGPTYLDPFTGTGLRMEGENLVASVSDVDIRPLEGVEES